MVGGLSPGTHCEMLVPQHILNKFRDFRNALIMVCTAACLDPTGCNSGRCSAYKLQHQHQRQVPAILDGELQVVLWASVLHAATLVNEDIKH